MALQPSQNNTNEMDEASQSKRTYPDDINSIFDKYTFVYCWVHGLSTRGAAHKFDFNFRLWYRSGHEFVDFHIDFKTLQTLLSYVYDEKIYFAVQKFPPTSTDAERTASLTKQLEFMENIMMNTNRIEYAKNIGNTKQIYTCEGPRKLHWYSKQLASADNDDLKAMANTLNKLLNSVQLVKVQDLYNVFNIVQHNCIRRNIFQTLNIPNDIKQHIQSEANKLLNKLKETDNIELSMGLAWTATDITTGVQFEESKESVQEGFAANQCRLNNPNACWKPRINEEEMKYEPTLIIKLCPRGMDVTKLRIQGYRLNGCFSYIKVFELYYWYKPENAEQFIWQYNNEYKPDWNKIDDEGCVDVLLAPIIYTRKIKLVPKQWKNEIALRLEIFAPLKFNHRQLLTLPHVMFQQLYVGFDLKNHWALKFEGQKYLLTIEWFANDKILSTLEENTCIGQRKCWYSSINDETEWFTQCWGTLFMLPIIRSDSEINQKQISAACIGKLIESWIAEFGKYDVTENNCQHFVRDMVSLFSKHAAKYLVGEMEHVQLNRAIHPLLEASDERSAHKRMHRIRQKLLCTFRQYQKDRKEREEKDCDPVVNKPSVVGRNEEKNKVISWLTNEVKLKEYIPLFINDGYDSMITIIETLREDDLVRMGIKKPGHRKKIILFIDKLKNGIK